MSVFGRVRRGPIAGAAIASVVAVVILLGGARAAHAKVRVAVPEFKIEGEGTPALALQLQDGFVLGLVRAGVQVFDPIDVARRLEGTPELSDCDTSPCLKNLAKLLTVKYVIRVKVEGAGNSYKMVARLFSTEGAAPAALPISTKSRSCDVCTVAEAREYMLKLADAVRPDLEDVAAPPVAPPAPPPPPPSLVTPLVAAMAGAVAVGIGIALLATLPDCHSTTVPSSCDDNRARSALGGSLIGAGLVTSTVGTTVAVWRGRIGSGAPAAPPATMVALTLPF